MTSESSRRFLTRPTGKTERGDGTDRRAIRRLWSLLYRAVRRQSVALDDATRRLDALERRFDALERGDARGGRTLPR